jgi:hypothetical protein
MLSRIVRAAARIGSPARAYTDGGGGCVVCGARSPTTMQL